MCNFFRFESFFRKKNVKGVMIDDTNELPTRKLNNNQTENLNRHGIALISVTFVFLSYTVHRGRKLTTWHV